MKQHISTVDLSKRYHRTKPFKGDTIYPLFQSCKENYNFENIKESVEKWTSYSANTDMSVRKVLELFDIVSENGTENNLKTITDRINESIIFSLESPSFLREGIMCRIKEAEEPSKIKYLSSILDRINEAVHCDRAIKNHDLISRRFNIDNYVRENAYGDSIKDTIYELCSFVDTYKVGVNAKYSLALEETLFAFSENNVRFDTKDIVESVTDYFLSNSMNPQDSSRELLHILSETAKQNRFFKEDDFKYLTELQESTVPVTEDASIDFILQEAMKDKTRELIDKFKTLPSKSPELFKQLMVNILVVNKDKDIAEGTTNLLSVAFYFCVVVGAFSLGVFAGLFAIIVSKTINMVMERKYMKEVLRVWYRDRESVAKKIEKCTDHKKKEKLEEYLKQMDKSIDALEAHSDSMQGDDEKKSWENNNRPGKDDGFNFDMNFDEETINSAIDIRVIESAVNSIEWDKATNERILFATDNITNLELDNVDYITGFAMKHPDMLDKDKLIEALEFADREASKNIMNYNKINCYAENLTKLKSLEIDGIKESIDGSNVFSDIIELQESTHVINSYVRAINELSITSGLHMATQKLANIASDLSDKEKIMSRTVDATCDSLSRSVEKSMTTENREAVIRGDILPSASKVIKMAVVTVGAAWLIHPAVAVIILLGKFAMSSKIRTKERQLVLNELEVELQMVDKYIAQAEDKKDLKRVRELLLIKKKLEAQESRLKYKIKIEWDDKTVRSTDAKAKED